MTGWRWTGLAAIAVSAALPLGSASAASCRDFPGLRSQESARSVTVTFVNRTGEYRSVDWLDFDGQRSRALFKAREFCQQPSRPS